MRQVGRAGHGADVIPVVGELLSLGLWRSLANGSALYGVNEQKSIQQGMLKYIDMILHVFCHQPSAMVPYNLYITSVYTERKDSQKYATNHWLFRAA